MQLNYMIKKDLFGTLLIKKIQSLTLPLYQQAQKEFTNKYKKIKNQEHKY